MMEKKSSFSITLLGALFFAVSILPILFYLFARKEIIEYSLIPSVIYVSFGMIVIKKWSTLKYWQKGSLTAIGIQAVLLVISNFIELALSNRQMPDYIFNLWFRLGYITSPLNRVYETFVISPRAVIGPEGAYFETYWWELGLLFPFLLFIYAGLLGALISKIIDKIKNSSAKTKAIL